MSPDGHLIEAIEFRSILFFGGVQLDTECKSRPNRPHPLIAAFIGARLRI